MVAARMCLDTLRSRRESPGRSRLRPLDLVSPLHDGRQRRNVTVFPPDQPLVVESNFGGSATATAQVSS
jgi:hypothetical protein